MQDVDRNQITEPDELNEYRMSNKEFRMMKFDGLVKSLKTPVCVIPVKTGIQEIQEVLDSRLRGSDDLGDFLRTHQV
jgi:hypothetical protein